jgi:hypothetical protein
MSRHSEIENKLVKFLVEDRGFDRKILLFDPTYTNTEGITNVRPDLVGIESNSKEPIVIFEVKTSLTEDKEAKYISQLLSYAKIDKHRAIPVYLVIAGEYLTLEFYKFNDDNELEPIDSSDIPTYGDFLRAKLAPKLPNLKKESESEKRKFKLLCFTIALLAFILVILDIYLSQKINFELLTIGRIALIGTAIALLLIPYAQKFKGLGIEYERLQTEIQKD